MTQKGSAIDLSEYIIRVFTDDYRYRLSFQPQQTYGQLLQVLSGKIGLPPYQLQVFSQSGRRLNIRPQKMLKEVIYLRHGSILKVDLPKKQKSSVATHSDTYIRDYNQPRQDSKVKSPCKHPSNMKCLNCLNTESTNNYYAGNGLMTSAPNPKIQENVKCDHGPLMKCLRCLDKKDEGIQAKKEEKVTPIVATPQKVNPAGKQEGRKSPPTTGNIYINSLKKSKSTGMLKTQSSLSSPKNQNSPIQSPPKSPQKVNQVQKQSCLHGPLGKCLSCINPSQKAVPVDSQKKKCNHGPNSKCNHCIDIVQNKAAHIPFDEYLLNRSKNCANNHPKASECPNCQPPRNLRLQLNTHCDQHESYPKGLCNRCLPQNVTLKQQEYRHVDYVQYMNHSQIQNFIHYWVEQKKMAEMRIAFVYGYYAQDPFYKNGIRAIVQAIYEPEQNCTANRFQLKDPSRKVENLELIVESLGLEKIGIIIASPYEDVYFTEEHVRTIADFQQNQSVTHQTGYKLSNLLTILIRPNKKDKNLIEPQVFMISDQGQALQSANLFQPNPSNPKRMKLKKSQNEILPTVYEGGKQVKQFDLQFLLVKIASGVSKSNKFAILKNNEFPILNRGKVKKNVLRDYIKANFRKNNLVKYGDLNLLLLIAQLAGVQSAMQIALKVSGEQPIENSLNQLVNKKIEALL